MLNFEEEAKKVQTGYVVMSLEEYNKLNDKVLDYSVRAIRAESEARNKVMLAEQAAEQLLRDLLTVRKKTYGDKAIEIHFNDRAIHKLANERLKETYPDLVIDGYEIVSADDLSLYETTIAYIKGTKE